MGPIKYFGAICSQNIPLGSFERISLISEKSLGTLGLGVLAGMLHVPNMLNRALSSLSELQTSYQMIHFASQRHRQIADSLNKLQPQLRLLNTLTTFESLCVDLPESKHLLSQMYKLVLSAQSTSVPYYIKEWKRELGQDFTPSQIQSIIRLTHTTSISSRVQETS